MKYFKTFSLILLLNCALLCNAQFKKYKPISNEEFPSLALGFGIGTEAYYKAHTNYKFHGNFHIENKWNFNICISDLLSRPFKNRTERMENNRFSIDLSTHYTIFKSKKKKRKKSHIYGNYNTIIKKNEFGIKTGFYRGNSYIKEPPINRNNIEYSGTYFFQPTGDQYTINTLFLGFQKISNNNNLRISNSSNLFKKFIRNRTYFEVMYSIGPRDQDFQYQTYDTDNVLVFGVWNVENSNLKYHPWGFRFGIEKYLLNSSNQNFYSKFEYGTKPGFSHDNLPAFFIELSIGTIIGFDL